MNLLPRSGSFAPMIALGALFAVALVAGTACAKPWAKWAPGPLDSDSSFAALHGKPPDSLSAAEVTWLSVQRYWRTQRAEEAEEELPSSVTSSVTASGHKHRTRPGDERFARLASRPFASLGDRELAWLVTESAAQHESREAASAGRARSAVGVVLLMAVAGVIGTAWALGSALSGN